MIHDNDIKTFAAEDGTLYRFRISIEPDDDMPPPWESSDGHGPVSDWSLRNKRAGEWVLSRDRGMKRYYDAAEANRIAKRDGWGLSDTHRIALVKRLAHPRVQRGSLTDGNTAFTRIPGRDPAKPLTAGEIRAEAVRRDYDYLRQWCNDDWRYCGIVVTPLGDDPDDDDTVRTRYTCALWGIEDDDYCYHESVALELMSEAASRMHREYLESRYWRSRDHITI